MRTTAKMRWSLMRSPAMALISASSLAMISRARMGDRHGTCQRLGHGAMNPAPDVHADFAFSAHLGLAF
jgi:hypothetical protein